MNMSSFNKKVYKIAKTLVIILIFIVLITFFVLPTKYLEEETNESKVVMFVNNISKITVVTEFKKEEKIINDKKEIKYSKVKSCYGYAVKIKDKEKTYFYLPIILGGYYFENKSYDNESVSLIKILFAPHYNFTTIEQL